MHLRGFSKVTSLFASMLRPPEHPNTQQYHRQAQHLPHGHPAKGEVAELGIRLAHPFHDKTEYPVAQQKQAGDSSLGSRLTGIGPENNEKRDAFERELIELRRMPWQRTGVGKYHAPGHVGDAPPEFMVDEIAEAPGAETERC